MLTSEVGNLDLIPGQSHAAPASAGSFLNSDL